MSAGQASPTAALLIHFALSGEVVPSVAMPVSRRVSWCPLGLIGSGWMAVHLMVHTGRSPPTLGSLLPSSLLKAAGVGPVLGQVQRLPPGVWAVSLSALLFVHTICHSFG